MDADLKAPSRWDDAMSEAEDACWRKLNEVLGLVGGVNSFTGIKSDNAVECAVFDIGKPESGEQFGFVSDKFHFRGQVDFYHRDRKELMRWIMRTIGLLPCQTRQATDAKIPNSNVYCFRIQPLSNCANVITTVEIPVGRISDGKKVEVFTTSIFFDIVFFAGERTPAS